ncbi:hypothetical protein [Sphingomonas sp.]|uniref:hypothetical protein n=1 Tax=Sphingomonas sp. TaxID=28214 RepID=UPI0028ABEB98|nr:hypothetical protein [Sphingomonas sp.]
MRAVLSKIVAGSMIAGAALLASACTSNTETNVNNTTEVVAPENTTDASVTNVDVAAPVDNGAMTDNAMMNASNAM